MQDPKKLTAKEEQALAALFQDARASEPHPSEALLTRVIADAAAAASVKTPSVETQRTPLWDRLGGVFLNLGGLPGASVMTASVMLGLVFGYAGPDNLLDLSSLGVETLSEFDTDMEVFDTADFSFDEGDLLQ